MLCLLAVAALVGLLVGIEFGGAPTTGEVLTPFIVGGSGRGACIRAQLDPTDCQDMADCAELVDQMEAWPEDPELVDETEMRGR